MDNEKKKNRGERIKEIIEVIIAFISLGMVLYLSKSLITEAIYRNDKEIDFSTNIYIDNDIVSSENIKELVQEGNVNLIMRMTFSNSTKYALTISDVKVEMFEKNDEGKYKAILETRPHLLERDSDVASDAALENNVYFLTIPSGEARDAYFMLKAPLSDEEKMQLLKYENWVNDDFEEAFNRIISNCIARTYGDYEGVFRVSYNHYNADKEENEIQKCYSFEYNLNESSMPINVTDINASFVMHTMELDDSALPKYTVYTAKLPTTYTDDLDARLRTVCGYFPKRSVELDKIAYLYNITAEDFTPAEYLEYQGILEEYTGHQMYVIWNTTDYEDCNQGIIDFCENESNIDIIKHQSRNSKYVGINVYQLENGGCRIAFAFSNEE